MRTTILLGLLLAAACGGESITPEPNPLPVASGPRVDAVAPSHVSVEGGELATVFGARFCASPMLVVDGYELPIKSANSRELTFVVPPARSFEEIASVEVSVTCGEESDRSPDALTYDPALVVRPQVVAYGPVGDDARPDAGTWVQFNRAMDPESLAGRMGIEGVDGRVLWDARTFVAAFVPNEPLARGERFVAFLRGEEDGVRSSFGDALPEGVIWRFRSCQSCTVTRP